MNILNALIWLTLYGFGLFEGLWNHNYPEATFLLVLAMGAKPEIK